MTDEAFNPDEHMWQFEGYCEFEFAFRTVDEPRHYAAFGRDGDDIYDYNVWAGEMSYYQVTNLGTLKPIWKDWEE